MRHLFSIILAPIVLLLFVSLPARAGILIEIAESGSDLLITTSGSLNTIGLTGHTDTVNLKSWGFGSGAADHPEWFAFGSSAQDYYSGDADGLVGYSSNVSWTGTTGSISGLSILLDSGLANFGFRTGSRNDIWIPDGYVSGTIVSQVLRRQNASFASLGLNVGDFAEVSWTGSVEGSGDTMRMQVGAISTNVPEPTSLSVFGLGGLGLVVGSVRRRRQKG